MGKDREGNYHPPAGKPSGTGQQTENIVNDKTLVQQFEIEDKYGIDPDNNEVSGIRVVNPNRNTSKGESSKNPESIKKNLQKSRTEPMIGQRSELTPEQLTDLSKETLQDLFAFNADICISAYLPTHRKGSDVNDQVDPILFKNILQRAESEYQFRNSEEIRTFFESGYSLLRDEAFWKSINAPGIAFFMAKGFFKYILLPTAPTEQLQISHTFLIGPLVTYVTDRDYFYLLVISKKQSKLFRADRFGIQFVQIQEMPNGIDDVVHLEEKEGQRLFRTGSSSAGSGASFHGTGSGAPDEKENIAMYLAEVDSTIRKAVLMEEHVPLLVAGVDYLIPIFKKVTHYKHVWEAPLTGSHEHDNDQSLHHQALRIMTPYFEERKIRALSEYGDQSATEKTSSVADDVIRAAFYSRVSTLFIKRDMTLWGTFDEKNDELVLHETEKPGDENLADKTVLKTILNGGTVYMLEESELPQGALVAATMRY